MFNMASEGRTLTRLSLLKQLFSTGTCDCSLNCTLGKVKFRADFRFEKYIGFFFFFFLSLNNFHSYYFAFLEDGEDSGFFFAPYCCVPCESPVVREPRHNSYWRYNLRFCSIKYYQ